MVSLPIPHVQRDDSKAILVLSTQRIEGQEPMIVSNSGKFIYLRVPRTGSTSLSNFLIENLPLSKDADFHTPVPYNRIAGLNFSAAEHVHATLDDILGFGILQYPLEEYSVFGIVRDPVDRLLSSAWHACQQHGVEASTNDQAVGYAWQVMNPMAPIFRPQTAWLVHEGRPINRIFAYEQLDRLAQELVGSGQAQVTFRHRSESRGRRNTDLDTTLASRIRDLYRDDQDLYESVLAMGGVRKVGGDAR
jgi:hypothetical protein